MCLVVCIKNQYVINYKQIGLHVIDHGGAKFRSFQFGGTFHKPVEIVGNGFTGNGFFHRIVNEAGSFVPPQVFEHQGAG